MNLKSVFTIFLVLVCGWMMTVSAYNISTFGRNVSRVPIGWWLTFGLPASLTLGLISRNWQSGRKYQSLLIISLLVLAIFLSAWLEGQFGLLVPRRR